MTIYSAADDLVWLIPTDGTFLLLLCFQFDGDHFMLPTNILVGMRINPKLICIIAVYKNVFSTKCVLFVYKKIAILPFKNHDRFFDRFFFRIPEQLEE